MAKIISGDKSGGQYSADLQTVINLLDGHDAGASAPTNPVEGQIWFDTGASRVKIYNGTTFIALPIEISGANQGAIAGGTGIVDLDLRVFASGVVDEDLGTGISNNETLASALAVKTYVDASVLTQTGTTISNPILTGTIRGSGTMILDPDPDGANGTLRINGNLDVQGTTTTLNSASTTDHFIRLDSDVTAENAIVNGAGIVLGASIDDGYSATDDRHSLTYDNTNDRWVSSDGFEALSYNIGANTIITATGDWRGNTIRIDEGGTGQGTKIGFNYLSDTPDDFLAATPGEVVVVNANNDGLIFSSSTVDISLVGDWARKNGGSTGTVIGDPTADNSVLHYDGTDYAFVNADTLAVKLGATDDVSVASVSTSGNIKQQVTYK